MLLNPKPAALRSIRYTSCVICGATHLFTSFHLIGWKNISGFRSWFHRLSSSKGKDTYLACKRYSANDISCEG